MCNLKKFLKMALSTKREDIKCVPWFSLAEWHKVYKEIYSNDEADQIKAYERLLAWKERIPKLPVGVDCTLSILQVCIRDREWTPKINNGELSTHYKNDLCLMYSTTLMRFLNHISNIGHTKQTSLFQIAKQLKIPEWIVNLRHDAAHGHKLPSIDVLRIAINILLTWLHDEYWLPEAKAMEENYIKETQIMELEESEEVEAFRDLIELWTAVGLYIRADYRFVNDVPDKQLRDTLEDLRVYVSNLSQQDCNDEESNEQDGVRAAKYLKRDDTYHLSSAQSILLSEISRYLGKSKWVPKKEDVVLDVLLNSAAFLPNGKTLAVFEEEGDKNILEKNDLPADLIRFWQDVLFLLEGKKMIEPLIFKLLKTIDNVHLSKERRMLAALWLKCIGYSYVKLNVAQDVSRTLELKSKDVKKKSPFKKLNFKVKEEINRTRPDLKDVLWFKLSSTVPHSLMDIKFVTKLIETVNEFTIKCIVPFFELVTPILDSCKKRQLFDLMEIYTLGRNSDNKNELNGGNYEKEFTIEDLCKVQGENMQISHCDETDTRKESFPVVTDRIIRNTHWQLASEDYQWGAYPIGILPWQSETLEMLEPLDTVPSRYVIPDNESVIIPGIIDGKDLKMRSRVNWDTVLREKKRQKRKETSEHSVIDRAVQIAKTRD